MQDKEQQQKESIRIRALEQYKERVQRCKKGWAQERAKVWERAREQERVRVHERAGWSKSRHEEEVSAHKREWV